MDTVAITVIGLIVMIFFLIAVSLLELIPEFQFRLVVCAKKKSLRL